MQMQVCSVRDRILKSEILKIIFKNFNAVPSVGSKTWLLSPKFLYSVMRLVRTTLAKICISDPQQPWEQATRH